MRKKVKKKFIVILSLTFLVLLLGGVIGYNIPISFGGSYPPSWKKQRYSAVAALKSSAVISFSVLSI